jgi:hypothetical protein
MTTDLSTKTALICDNGLFVELADVLSRSFGRVIYWTPCKVGAFPKSVSSKIGIGIDSIERITEFWDYVDEADIFIFPDIYYADLQKHLRDEGRLVWGMGGAEFLELDRWKSRKLQGKLGLPVPPTKMCHGVEELKNYLNGKENMYVKVSTYRGDQETFEYVNDFTMEPMIAKLTATLGPEAEDYPFMVEGQIKGVEIGYDGFTVDGQFPLISAYGYEIKASGYIGKIGEYKSFPAALTTVNSGLAKVFKENNARGFFSTEVRVGKDKVPYLTDPCMRCASPPSEAMFEAYYNLAEIIWEGAGGNLIVPKPKGKFALMSVINSEWADSNWMPIDFPEENRPNIKFRYLAVIDGKYYIAPAETGLFKLGGVIAIEDSIDACIAKIKEVAKSIKGYKLTVETEFFDKGMETIEEGRKYGINF